MKGKVLRADGRERRRMTVYLPVDLAKQLAVRAAETDLDMSDVVTEALEDKLNRRAHIVAIGDEIARTHAGILRALSATDRNHEESERAMGEQTILFQDNKRFRLVPMTEVQIRAWYAYLSKQDGDLLGMAAPSDVQAVVEQPNSSVGPRLSDAVDERVMSNGGDVLETRRRRNKDAEMRVHLVRLSTGTAAHIRIGKQDRDACVDADLVSIDAILDTVGRGAKAKITGGVVVALAYVHSAYPKHAIALARGLVGKDGNIHSRELYIALSSIPPGSGDNRLRYTLVISAALGIIKGRARPTVSADCAFAAKTLIETERAKRGLPVPTGEDLSVFRKAHTA